MKLFDPDPSLTWLFCMTHPDDEISIAAWILRLAKSGVNVHISWTHSTPVREAEARNAGNLLGVPPDHLHFLAAPDGAVCDHLLELEPTFQDLIQRVRPDRIVCGAYEQGHIDHDATNLLVNRNFKGPVLEVPFYHTYADPLMIVNRFATKEGGELLRTTKAEALFKRQVARMYPSQKIKDILFWAERFRKVIGKEPLAATERLRLQIWKDFTLPNLPARKAKRVLASRKWSHWRRAVDRYLAG